MTPRRTRRQFHFRRCEWKLLSKRLTESFVLPASLRSVLSWRLAWLSQPLAPTASPQAVLSPMNSLRTPRASENYTSPSRRLTAQTSRQVVQVRPPVPRLPLWRTGGSNRETVKISTAIPGIACGPATTALHTSKVTNLGKVIGGNTDTSFALFNARGVFSSGQLTGSVTR